MSIPSAWALILLVIYLIIRFVDFRDGSDE